MSGTDFSKRVRSHPRIFPYQPLPTQPLVLVVKDQLLVCHDAASAVHLWLDQNHIPWKLLTTFLDGLPPDPKVEDVEILELKLVPPHDIVKIVRALRLEPKVGPRGVSPNHVLIPAMLDHGCPWGPPSPSGTLPLTAAIPPFQPVTIIDSGYQWDPAWGQNPLDHLGPGAVVVHEAETIGPDATQPTGYGWIPGTPDVLDADGDGRLDALAGHANFIAGVIGRGCPHAHLTIRNHNGGFAPASDDFPTEAAVARSLYESAGAKVIDVGFAFTALDDLISCVWTAAYTHLANESMVVVPAGNQSSSTPYYPAALNRTFPGLFPNVIGVASLHRASNGVLKCSSFSNRGDWVTCSAVGENVKSTFLHVDMACEDDPATNAAKRDFTKSWALWNGTSFAAPKVAAAIAKELAAGVPPAAAWASVADSGTPDGASELGVMLDL